MDRIEVVDSKDRTDELCKLFTSSISSLSADTEALKQLLCLKMVIETEEEANGENMDPSGPPSRSNDTAVVKDTGAEATIENLCLIESTVTELERKIQVLREIVIEENRAITELESVKHAAEAQREVLEYMVEGCAGMRLAGVKFDSRSSDNSDLSRSIPSQQNGSTDGHKPTKQSQPTNIRIPRVSDPEFKSVSKTIRGRATLMDLNDALTDIEKVCVNKYKELYHYKKSTEQLFHGGWEQRMVETQNHPRVHRHLELQTDEHGDRPWVAEEDLRHSCAFFRIGESTARAILTILRTLKRIKQVPGKKTSEVTYIVFCD